jgi:hypothetical protein
VTIRIPRRFRLAAASTLAIGIALALSPTLVKRTHAFTLIELQFFFDPSLVGPDQNAEVIFNNTFASRDIAITVNWGDGITGGSIGAPFSAEVTPGHGAVSLLPAVQTPGAGAANTAAARMVVAHITLTPGPNAQGSLPKGVEGMVGASLVVFNKATNDVVSVQAPALVPAVQ